MAQPTNTYDTYDNATAIKEDISKVVYNISPDETPFYSKTKKASADATFVEWLTEALRASGDNAHIEGDDSTATAVTPAARLGNYTQIFKDVAIISGTSDNTDGIGQKGKMAKEILKKATEQKLDIERALFLNQARVAGSATVARKLAGIPAWITTNTSKATAGSPADPTGDGTDARTDGTALAFTQTRFDTVMQAIWKSGGKADSCYLSSEQMTTALGFTGNNNQRATIDAKGGTVAKVMDVYMTPWGSITFIPSRENRAKDVFLLQSDMWKIRTKRATKQEPLAKTGDSEKRHVITELTLEACNEKASGGVFDNIV